MHEKFKLVCSLLQPDGIFFFLSSFWYTLGCKHAIQNVVIGPAGRLEAATQAKILSQM